MKSLEENPSNRFSNAQEFMKALDSVLKLQIRAADTYPCYSCGGLVQFHALFCSKCGKDLLEARKEKERSYQVGQERVREAVDRGEFQSALNELNELERKMEHDHFAHFRKEIAEKAKWVQGEWQRAEKKKEDAEHLLKEAEIALDQLDVAKASKISNEVKSCTGPYFRTVVSSAQRILDEIQAIEQNRLALAKQFEVAEKDANDLALRCEFDQGREKLEGLVKDLKGKDLLIHKEVVEKVESKLSAIEASREKAEALRMELKGLLEDAQAAFEQLNLDKAAEIASEITKHDEAFFRSLYSEAEEIKRNIQQIEETKRRFELALIQAEEAAKEHDYARASELLEQIISDGSIAYESQRTRAYEARERYQSEKAQYDRKIYIEGLRKKFSEQISGARTTRKKAKSLLKEVLATEESDFEDQRAEAKKILFWLRVRRTSRLAFIIMLFVSVGISVSYLPVFQPLRNMLYAQSKNIKIGDQNLYTYVRHVKISIQNIYPNRDQFETYHMDTLLGKATVKSTACLYSDSALKEDNSEIQLPLYVDIFGFVRNSKGAVIALQTVFGGERKPSYISIDDITGFMQEDENGSYLKVLINSSIFNKSGKADAKETMKNIDRFLSSYPQAKVSSHAILDYIQCLDWLFHHDNSVKKDSIITLTEMYVQKARQYFPGTPQTVKCEQLLINMKKAGT